MEHHRLVNRSIASSSLASLEIAQVASRRLIFPRTMSVVGLDFGNEFAVLAQAKRGGVDIVLNENSQRLNRLGFVVAV